MPYSSRPEAVLPRLRLGGPAAAALALLLARCGRGGAGFPAPTPAPGSASATRSVSQGAVQATVPNLFLYPGARVSALGTAVSTDGKAWTVPAEVTYPGGPRASDLYNECTGVTPASFSQIDLAALPTVTVDADGEVITGLVFADNYFELYVNGQLVAVDPVPYTPFNSCVVKFRARRPVTYAFRLVDWEENLGVGSEVQGSDAWHAGDGGLIASFSDGTVTNGTWKAQAFYIAPLASPDLVVEGADGSRSSAGASSAPGCAGSCYAVHYPVPAGWSTKSFDDSGWPAASVYTEAAVGVDAKPAFTRFAPQFSGAGARFIWSSNLVLDNLVLVRKTVP